MFKEFGEVMDCCVLKGYAFIHMTETDDAKNAIAALDKKEINGNAINVELSTTRVQKATKLFVGNLPEGTKSAEIHKLFKQYGTVIECDVVKNFAFVHMARDNMARDAINALNKTDLNGNDITVQMARQKQDMDGGFRGGRGGRFGGFGPRGGMGMGMPPRFMRRGMYDPYMMGMGGMGMGMGRGGFRNGGMRPRGGMGGDFGFRREMALAAQREQMMMEREAYGRQLVGDYGGYDATGYGANAGYDFTADQTGADGNGFGLW